MGVRETFKIQLLYYNKEVFNKTLKIRGKMEKFPVLKLYFVVYFIKSSLLIYTPSKISLPGGYVKISASA